MNILVRKETQKDYDIVRRLIKSAFYREGKAVEFNEWSLVEEIRATEYYINELSLVAEVNGNIVGHVMFTPLKINGESTSHESLALAPMAVAKEYQKMGIGKRLINDAIEKARKLDYKSIIVLGHPDYYTKFSFEKAAKWRIGTTTEFNDEYLFALELVKDGLKGVSGVIRYCPAFYNENGELI